MTTDSIDGRTAEDRRRLAICSEIEALIASVAETHPGLGIRELASLLPEQQRTRLLVLLAESREWIPFPRSNDE